jgi:hypothetical protein
MASHFRAGSCGIWILAILAGLSVSNGIAQDFSDPADILTYKHKQQANHAASPEIDGTILATSSAKPGWYGVDLKLDNGKQIRVIVVPATRFFKDYISIASPAAYPQLVQGCKIRALHDPDQDLLLRNIILTDLMFSSPPVEFAGTIKAAASAQPGVYDLTVTLDKGGEHHFNVDQQTKFWKKDQPFDQAKAYAQLTSGQKIRALETAAPAGQHHTSDLMLVDP